MDEGSPESVILKSVLEAMEEYYSLNLEREPQKGEQDFNMLTKIVEHNGKLRDQPVEFISFVPI